MSREPLVPMTFVEAVDPRTATILAHGPLTEQAADLLRGAVEMLLRSGNAHVTVDLRDVDTVADAALADLRALAALLQTRHAELTLLPTSPTR